MSSKNKAETKAEAVEAAEGKKPETKENLVYLGPTITGVVRHSDAFQDGILPERAQKCVAEFPMMERLFVKVDDLPKAVKELRKEQSVLSTIYKQTVNKYQTRR